MGDFECHFHEREPGRRLLVLRSRTADESRPWLFFLHGAMAGAFTFEQILPDLAARYNVVAYDALGCGQSQKPKEADAYATSELIKDMTTVFDTYIPTNRTRSTVVVGHSYGVAQAARLVAYLKREDRVDQLLGIVLMGAADHIPSGGE